MNGNDDASDFDVDDFGGDGDVLDDLAVSNIAFEHIQESTQENDLEDELGSLSHIMYKNPSKRSLDDAEFDFVDGDEDEEVDTTPST